MGLCESRETEHISKQRTDSFIKSSHSSKDQFKQDTHQLNSVPYKYETVIIQDNLKTIAEESIIQQDRSIQYQSTATSPQESKDMKQVSQQIPLMIKNPAGTWSLQAHIIKHGGMYEVSVGKECIDMYEEWEFILNHDGPIVNFDRFVLRHLLTESLLVAEESLQGEYKVGSIASKTMKDQAMWQLEIGSDILCENTLVKLRHSQSKLYLSRTNENGSMENHRRVALTKFDPINSFWLVKLK
ncbi:unnamed protein product (macronuclear) [Paramecium tetraurelia]|uniref:MIR domain-containing protein n=1 Tax=Paramecium tetraurelia TaxID=5888 RepID=A0D8Q0_PARTE|nr:uncharacterized protein GSPATT00014363001 [Paramecium tetraurelia]CAK79417.1 unnamed protein product [Paramecium tetraurelia]|eukprot:XP_001446814.1 hypothetical protein (macronuclear) [Paramecium tetraurelia strain d4-2]